MLAGPRTQGTQGDRCSLLCLLKGNFGGESMPPLGHTNREEPKVEGMGSTKSPSGSLAIMASGITPTSMSWFTDPWAFPVGDVVPYQRLCFGVYTQSWRMALHPCRVLPLSWHFSCTFSRQSYCSMMSSCILNGTVCNTTSASHDYESTPPPPVL